MQNPTSLMLSGKGGGKMVVEPLPTSDPTLGTVQWIFNLYPVHYCHQGWLPLLSPEYHLSAGRLDRSRTQPWFEANQWLVEQYDLGYQPLALLRKHSPWWLANSESIIRLALAIAWRLVGARMLNQLKPEKEPNIMRKLSALQRIELLELIEQGQLEGWRESSRRVLWSAIHDPSQLTYLGLQVLIHQLGVYPGLKWRTLWRCDPHCFRKVVWLERPDRRHDCPMARLWSDLSLEPLDE